MRYLLLAVCAALFTLTSGCANMADIFRTDDSSAGLGTHVYTVGPDGTIKLEVHSVYGGPGLEVSTDSDGQLRTISVKPAGKLTINDLLPLLQ